MGKRKNSYFCRPLARVAELVDALDSKSSNFGCAGSIPASSTKGLQIEAKPRKLNYLRGFSFLTISSNIK